MSDPEFSVSEWVAGLRHGSPEAVQQLWERYVASLASYIRRRVGHTPFPAGDDEDVVVDVFDSLCRGAQRGRFPRLDDRDDLWQVLIMLTNNKIVDRLRRRAGPATESGLGDQGARGDGTAPLAMVADDAPTPAFAAEAAEQFEFLLSLLNAHELAALRRQRLGGLADEDLSRLLRSLALEKMDGYTNAEMAQRHRLTVRVVERALQLIRVIWIRNGHRP